VVLGAVADLTAVWEAVDLLCGLLAIPNLLALMLLAPEVMHLLRNWAKRKVKTEKN